MYNYNTILPSVKIFLVKKVKTFTDNFKNYSS